MNDDDGLKWTGNIPFNNIVHLTIFLVGNTCRARCQLTKVLMAATILPFVDPITFYDCETGKSK